ncbi:MAG TPA: hypothetical protein VG737_12335 [Cyclobacteriaceae bacterium]|nr:hypothetical protein [Cyclobacteriaceae bacterium]
MTTSTKSLTTEVLPTAISFAAVGAAVSVLFQVRGGTCGDYPQHFQVFYIGVVAGLLIGATFGFMANREQLAMARSINTDLIRYFLACVLLFYGIVKVMATQFPHMMANMDARFIELNPMRVAWTFFGYSRGYQMFLGWGEMLPAILLLFRRTTLLGAIVAAIVMLNVFFINVFFEVCLKLNSGLYFGLAMFLVLQQTGRLWKFFIANKEVAAEEEVELKPAKLKMTVRVLNWLMVAGILLWAGEKLYDTYQYSTRLASMPSVQGAWRVEKVRKWDDGQWRPVDATDSLCANKLYFEGSLGVIKNDMIRDRFILKTDELMKDLTLTFRTANNEFEPDLHWRFDVKSDSLEIWGRWKRDSLNMKCVLRKERLTLF